MDDKEKQFKKLSFQVTQEFHKMIEREAHRKMISKSELLRNAVEAYLRA